VISSAMANDLVANKKAAYYSGCFANYYYPQVGQATIEVLSRSGIEVVAPDQVCCALPMVAKGNIRAHIEAWHIIPRCSVG
jgi:glycerol-3-phosphate dehydrogenase subunit C